MIAELDGQKNDVYELGDYSDDERSITPSDNVANDSTEDVNSSNRGENNSSDNFTQDSSDITQTEFDSSDYYEEF